MNAWLDFALVALAVAASLGYAVYALGPRRIKDAYSRFATRYFGLRAARWFGGTSQDGCNNCSANPHQEKKIL
jgi:hypothetical protein